MPRLFLLAILLLPLLPAHAQSSAIQLRRALESNYGDWHRAILRKDLDAWSRAIAPSRRVMTRNLIISQGHPWPAALFSTPIVPPALASLNFLKAQSNPEGNTAIAVYYGSVDLGLPPPPGEKIPESVFVAFFVKEPKTGAWKFDRTRILPLGPATTPDGEPGLRTRIARGERAFLEGPAFEPYPYPPATPPSVERRPDYVAHLTVTSRGYQTRVRINGGLHDSITVNDTTRDIVIGGLREGKNTIDITTQPLAPPNDNAEARDEGAVVASRRDATNTPDSQSAQDPPFQIQVHVIRDAEKLPPATIFTYAPATPPASHTAPLWANAVTIP